MIKQFEAFKETLGKIFDELQIHEDEFAQFEKIDQIPCLGTFKMNGNGEVRVAIDFNELEGLRWETSGPALIRP